MSSMQQKRESQAQAEAKAREKQQAQAREKQQAQAREKQQAQARERQQAEARERQQAEARERQQAQAREKQQAQARGQQAASPPASTYRYQGQQPEGIPRDSGARQAAERPRASVETQHRLARYRKELAERLSGDLTQLGYLPPAPPPLLRQRASHALHRDVRANARDSEVIEAATTLARQIDEESQASANFVEELKGTLLPKSAVVSRMLSLVQRIDGIIDTAVVSTEIPAVSQELTKQMLSIEHFLAGNWVTAERRGMLAVHLDKQAGTTILQIGIAQHGTIYVTIPKVIEPDDIAMRSLTELLSRMEPFSRVVDPMAVIDGEYQTLNFGALFTSSRVLRAPSGNVARLAANIAKTEQRVRLSPENTVIVSSVPTTVEQYRNMIPGDLRASGWGAWRNEANLWRGTVVGSSFISSPTASQQALLDGLTQAENVIVLVAHCDGKTLYMPDPPPNGTVVTADFLIEHREAISRNAPFVYLFSCKAGNVENQRNFASTLLDCGASGVIASQTTMGSAEGRTMLARLLDTGRRAPPIQDYFQAQREVNYFQMEVFLA